MATPSRPRLLSRYSWRIVSSRYRRPTSSSRSKRNGASLCIRTRSRRSRELKPGSKRIAIRVTGIAGAGVDPVRVRQCRMVRDLSDDPLRRACRSPLHRLLLSLGTNQIKTMHIKLSSKQLDSDTGYAGQDGRDGPTKGEHDECSALVRRPSSLAQRSSIRR